jgi:metal-responsive CopG/Arc/MetJ family transcriptional regulator
MGRVNVFLSDKLRDEINVEAKESGLSPSAIVQTALEEYLQAKREKPEEEEKRKKMLKASRKLL